ncbi:MAG TPA: alpha/beta hydrolase [Acidimicrobiales bacterium]|nr:alpha/beta hydrolase [Acidimicrobiales bacterium]
MRARAMGAGTPVVMIPSLGRPGADFDVLAAEVAGAGYTAVVLDPPSVDGVAGLAPGATLHDLAAAAAAAVAPWPGPFHLIGHAFGGRVARCLAADRPGQVRSLVVLGAGGRVEGDPEALAALMRCFDDTLGPDEHLEAVGTAFFAPGGDPSAWRDGWWAEAARSQRQATAATPVEDWWTPPPGLPMMVIVGAQDRISPPANARLLAAEVGPQVSVVEIDGAGHALLPERPAEVAARVVAFLDGDGAVTTP